MSQKTLTKEKFIENALAAHGDKFDYSLVELDNGSRSRVKIICQKHGVFEQVATTHTGKMARGCPKCKNDWRGEKPIKGTNGQRAVWNTGDKTSVFIEKAKAVHGDYYTYSQTRYVTSRDKLVVTCPVHGDFKLTANNFLRGKGCPSCGKAKIGDSLRMSLEEFLARANEKHNHKYSYEKVVYKTAKDPVEIVCPEHGAFFQQPYSHLIGRGCTACGCQTRSKKNSLGRDTFIERSKAVHGSKYDYSLVRYKNTTDPVTIICKEHGPFNQTPGNHLSDRGCKLCGIRSVAENQRLTKEQFIERATGVHGDLYDYSLVEYKRNSTKVVITCKEHGNFLMIPSDHLRGSGCPKCSSTYSKPANEMLDFIEQFCPDLQREVLIGKPEEGDPRWRADGYVPSLNLFIEYNGLIWHSTKYKADRSYHLKRQKLAEKYGNRMVYIHEDEWLHRREATENMLKHLVGFNKRLFARNCEVRPVEKIVAREFYNKNHIQGGTMVGWPVNLGLYEKGTDNLVAVMSFDSKTNNRKASKIPGVWELTRFSSTASVVGGASKLLKHFVSNYNFKELVSFSWSHLFNGNMYQTLGFELDKEYGPDYTYVDKREFKRIHKCRFQHKHLAKMFGENYDPNLTEEENTWNNSWYRIYDCGKKRWVLRNPNWVESAE